MREIGIFVTVNLTSLDSGQAELAADGRSPQQAHSVTHLCLESLRDPSVGGLIVHYTSSPAVPVLADRGRSRAAPLCPGTHGCV
ncbi:hypothetical protein NQZ68_003382 [Dissostichus eleginoides]|nr:hypothetical protein NQZ68_003382 [Dissostichus eleginoides]